MRGGRERVGRSKKIGRRSIGRTGGSRVSLGEVLYVCTGVDRKEPDVGTMIWELSHTGGESNGSRCTPCNMIETRSKSDGNTV